MLILEYQIITGTVMYLNIITLLRHIPLRLLCVFERLNDKAIQITADSIQWVKLYYSTLFNYKLDIEEVLFTVHHGGPISVYCNDKTVMFDGISKRTPGATVCIDSDNNPIIVINGSLIESDPWFLNAIIAQRAGHIILHFDKDKREFTKHLFSEKGEFAADLYAEQSTDMLRALHHMRYYGYNVNKRISHLTSKRSKTYFIT